MKLQGSVEQQSIQCLILVKQNPQWLQFSLMQFKSFQEERARNGEISYSTINNYYKATKLFIEMNIDTPIINGKRYQGVFRQAKKLLMIGLLQQRNF